MQRAGHCLFCGSSWAAGHVQQAHRRAVERHGRYAALVRSRVAPLLARLESERSQIEARLEKDALRDPSGGAALDERGQSARFEVAHEIDRSFADLLGQVGAPASRPSPILALPLFTSA